MIYYANENAPYIQHYGVLGMRWGHRKAKASYKSTGIRSAIARASNAKVDASFDVWKEKVKRKTTAIDLGKKANLSKMAYEKNKNDKNLKRKYAEDNKIYKKALRKNDTYNKGKVKREVGIDLGRKYLSEAKRIKKKEYKTSLKADKKIRRDLELKSYDSAMFTDAYYKKLKSYSKKYERAIAKDPTKSKLKTQRIENTKKLLNSNLKNWTNYNSENIRILKKQVDQMISKYSHTKIKDVDVKTMKNGVKYVKSFKAASYNLNVTYDLRKNKDSKHNVNIYTPVKTSHYVQYI